MEKVIKYRCSECGELFDIPEDALACERRHKRIEKANDMLEEGYTGDNTSIASTKAIAHTIGV